ncbi:MAG: 4,5-DOPA dioxygenase extradiol [Bacteroidota bacterium]
MERRKFLQSLALLPITFAAMKLNDINRVTEPFANTEELMPLLFLGHGSPMNAIEENEFVTGWRDIGKIIPKPKAIICISAHWETKGTFVTATEKPETIHDFGGFPRELFDVQYPAPGNPELAKETKDTIKSTTVALDTKWGLDHGCWSVISRLYPKADIPIIQLSIDYSQAPQYHYDLAKELSTLRNKGVLIVGSGNIVHNLGMVAWDKLDAGEYGFDWAKEASEKVKKLILSNDHKQLINYQSLGKEVALAVPTPEHYLPLLYILGLKKENEKVSLFNDKLVAGSLSMTALKIDKA